jgi:hypothetical protein
MARWSAYEASILVLAAAAYGFGAALVPTLIATGLASAALALTFVGAFVVAFVQIARHPERDKHWQPRVSVTGPQTLLFELQSTDPRSPQRIYGERCTVGHPNGGKFRATDEREDWATSVWFRYGGGNSHFLPDASAPVTGPYEVTWELRLKSGGRWHPIVHERDVRITMPEGES